MKDKFYNYLYDYMVREGFIKDMNPKDQKDKKMYVLNFLDKLRVLDNNLIRSIYLDKYVIKYSDIPESYFKQQELLNFNRGFGYDVLTEDERLNHAEMIINDQKVSLGNILDYFFSDSLNSYSDELKFWAFNGIIKLSKYNKETGEFGRRTKGTIFPFVELNREAFILTIDSMDSFLKNDVVDNEEMFKLFFNNNAGLNSSFVKLYTYFFNLVNNTKFNNNSNQGIWIKYEQRSDYTKLVDTLEGKGTGWCTVIKSVAERHVKNGDFYVYYTKDELENYTIPRIAIRMRDDDIILEISGVAKNQEVEDVLKGVLNQKLEEFPNRDRYLKKVHDMKLMTLIYEKVKKDIDLSIEELRFLYEIDDEIKGFGRTRDPRINEVIDTRDIKEDLAKIFNCSKEEIGVEPESLGNIPLKYYYGNLNLWCYDGNNLILPKVIMGNLYLDYLVNLGNIVFPEIVKKNLYLCNLRYVDEFILYSRVCGNVYLNGLRFAKKIIFLENVDGSVRLENLESVNRLVFGKNIDGNVHLDSLKYVGVLEFYGNVGKNIYLCNLLNADEVILSDACDYNNLDLSSFGSKNVLVKKRVKEIENKSEND